MPTAADASIIRGLLYDADTLHWDLDKGAIIFGKVD